jgi:glutamate-1-semialdehyde aminotransferase
VDQRKTAGLKRALKSVQFQLTYDRAEGAYIYDVDGNKYIDITGDNGVNLFGQQAPFIKKAMMERLDRGVPLVAYSEELFQVAKLFCELTGHERMVFAQSGTEAVMWATRIARAATGKKKVVIFDGSFHGLSDAVLAFRDRKGGSMSAGLGMLQEFADQLIILDYGKMEHLQVIEQHSEDIACVLAEPIQSRFPSRQPKEFLQELRKLTLEKNIVLIFDEMITGFRAGCKGAEGYFKVKPDITTYGKVVGGGMPTGVIAGLAKYMDYVDGGTWRFDDGSMPSLRRTMMAGTHTQNSLKVAAALALCTEMKNRCKAGPDCDYHSCFLSELNEKTKRMAEEINAFFAERRVPLVTEYFSSLFRMQVLDDPFGLVRELFMILLKKHGVETSTSGNCFFTTEHTDEDIRGVIEAVKKSIDIMLAEGFFEEPKEEAVEPAPAAVATATPASAAANPMPVATVPSMQLRALLLADLQGFQGRGH